MSGRPGHLAPGACPSYGRRVQMYGYRLHDTTGDDLGLIEHPRRTSSLGDVVVLANGREALVIARVEADGLVELHHVLKPTSAA
jgi:hypothetical protein